MTTKLNNGRFSDDTNTIFSSAFGSDLRDRGSIVARRNMRVQRRIARSV